VAVKRSRSGGVARGLALWAGVAVVVVVSAYLSFEFGRIQADYNVIEVAAERRAYENRIDDLEDQIVAFKEEVALLKTNREVDDAAYKDVEASLTELQRKIQEQRDAIEFYRGIISPADGGRGLRVQDLKLSKGSEEREYHVKLVLVQVMQHDRSVKGEVEFSLDGAQNGEAVTYTLEQLLPPDADHQWPFSFRYFQNFDRQLVLPKGFKPERINIEVRSKTKSIASVKQSFPWQAA
jgi:Family of unknown function (DUF6776)